MALPATLLLVTHDMDLAAKCHRVLRMAQGRIRESAPNDGSTCCTGRERP